MSTYLVAIAAGALESRQIGPRSRVWCEAEMVEAENDKSIEDSEIVDEKLLWHLYECWVQMVQGTYDYTEKNCPSGLTRRLVSI